MSATEAAATLQDYIDTWTPHKKIITTTTPPPPNSSNQTRPSADADDEKPRPGRESSGADRSSGKPKVVDGVWNREAWLVGNQVTAEDESRFEYVEGEDASLPWKCAACDFIDPAKHVVVEHWQQNHCAQVSFSITSVEEVMFSSALVS